MSLRLIFMGTPDFSAETLRQLVAAGHEIVAVYSQPPRPAGRRGLDLTPSPVHRLADALGIPVFTPLNFRGPADQAQLAAFQADAAVVVAYGLLLPEAVLAAPRLGCFNGHASLLPRWRGAAPIQRAIMAGDAETGVMIMKMDKGLDTGPVAMTARVAIAPDMTAGVLHDRLMVTGAALMVEAMAALEAGSLTLTPQADDGVLYAAKISKDETRIDFARPARDVHNHIRGLSPFPGAWFELDGQRVKVLESTLVDGEGESGTVIGEDGRVACASGAIRLTRLQKAGGKPLAIGDFLRGTALPLGQRLS